MYTIFIKLKIINFTIHLNSYWNVVQVGFSIGLFKNNYGNDNDNGAGNMHVYLNCILQWALCYWIENWIALTLDSYQEKSMQFNWLNLHHPRLLSSVLKVTFPHIDCYYIFLKHCFDTHNMFVFLNNFLFYVSLVCFVLCNKNSDKKKIYSIPLKFIDFISIEMKISTEKRRNQQKKRRNILVLKCILSFLCII